MTRKNQIRSGPYTAYFEMIGPKMAEKLMESNTHNRPLKPARYTFSRDMRNGRWTFNGNTICIAQDGTLEDGQNRLWAVIDSGTTQQFLVVEGFPREAQNTMDMGTKRTVGDQLQLSGEKDAFNLAAMVRLVVPLDSGMVSTKSFTPSFGECAQYIENHPDVRDGVHLISAARKYLPATGSAIGAAWYLCHKKDPAAARSFYWDRLIEQIGLTRDDPARMLRNRFERIRSEGGAKPDADETIRYCLYAWNLWRAGKKVTKFQGPRGGWTGKNFPHPK